MTTQNERIEANLVRKIEELLAHKFQTGQTSDEVEFELEAMYRRLDAVRA